jgi:hypothetical protein|tara:strand:- start:921 stop:1514 length:594 start_codon:yes stop_codon:yes gene_type:complete
MTFRVEEKLYITKDALFEFRKYINNKGASVIHEKRIVESLYFENKYMQMYKDSIEGSTPRKKIRIRSYPDQNKNNFYEEVKISSAEGKFKTRSIIDNKGYDQKINRGIFDTQYGLCNPKLYIKYAREYLKLNDVRITIDNNIEYTNYRNKLTHKDPRIIIEIKTSIKKNIDQLMKIFPFQRIRFSKYCNGIEINKIS